jgi:hypothetical protein
VAGIEAQPRHYKFRAGDCLRPAFQALSIFEQIQSPERQKWQIAWFLTFQAFKKPK